MKLTKGRINKILKTNRHTVKRMKPNTVINRTVSGNNDVELEIVFFSLNGYMTEKEKTEFEGIIKRIFNKT